MGTIVRHGWVVNSTWKEKVTKVNERLGLGMELVPGLRSSGTEVGTGTGPGAGVGNGNGNGAGVRTGVGTGAGAETGPGTGAGTGTWN